MHNIRSYQHRVNGTWQAATPSVRISGAWVPIVPLGSRTPMTLRGDPAFNPSSLTSEQQTRLTTMKSLINASPKRGPYWVAAKDCIWWYGHDMWSHVFAQSVMLRITGDMYFLDVIFELVRDMRAKLADSWRTPLGADVNPSDPKAVDGFLNWVHRENTNSFNLGTDLREDYDMQAHATSAFMTWILHNNRDLASPKGYSYGAQADWMLGYHLNHFEKKWRARKNKPSGFPIFVNTLPAQWDRWFTWSTWHHYMGLLTGNVAYTNEAKRLSDTFRTSALCQPSTPSGNAYVWQRNTPQTAPYGQYLTPTGYTEYVFSHALNYYLEGAHDWANVVHLQRFARSVTEFIIDTTSVVTNGVARDIGGGVSRCSYPASSSTEFPRKTAEWYAYSNYSTLSPFDPSGEIATIDAQIRTRAISQGWDYFRVLVGEFYRAHQGT
jgi:hypothetical protein